MEALRFIWNVTSANLNLYTNIFGAYTFCYPRWLEFDAVLKIPIFAGCKMLFKIDEPLHYLTVMQKTNQ